MIISRALDVITRNSTITSSDVNSFVHINFSGCRYATDIVHRFVQIAIQASPDSTKKELGACLV